MAEWTNAVVRDPSTKTMTNRSVIPIAGMTRDLGAQQRLDCAAFVHGAIPLRDLIERQRQVENPSGIDLPLPHLLDQIRQVATYRGWSAVKMNVA